MFLLRILHNALFVLLPLSLICTTYLYLYPIFNLCAFPSPEPTSSTSLPNTFFSTLKSHTPFSCTGERYLDDLPTFRLLAIGDPQLEGSSSLDSQAASLPHFRKLQETLHDRNSPAQQRYSEALTHLRGFWTSDIPRLANNWRKQLDLWGNDLYLAHIVRTAAWWSQPTHVTVLGDLLGSQWINDKEFATRARRFWHRVFPGYCKIEDHMYSNTSEEGPGGLTIHQLRRGKDAEDETEGWKKRLINVVGNHDVGYAGDITPRRVQRFEQAFGKVNYEMQFRIDIEPETYGRKQNMQPTLRVVVLNNMNLDTPVLSNKLQTDTYEFMNEVIQSSYAVESEGVFTLLLTHIPLHKEDGVCVDPPMFKYHQNGRKDILKGGIEEQNHLSQHSSTAAILEGIFGKSGNPAAAGAGQGRKGLIMTGHDHEGCDVWHFINQTSESPAWGARRFKDARKAQIPAMPNIPGLREVTVRSVMGDFGGNVGLLSVSFNTDTWEWESAFTNCALGKAWVWWAVHIVDLITLAVVSVWYFVDYYERLNPTVATIARNREQEREDWLAGRGYRDVYGRDPNGVRPVSRGKGGGTSAGRRQVDGSGSGSDSSSGSQRRRSTRKRSKASLRDKLGTGRRQLSAVFEVPESQEVAAH